MVKEEGLWITDKWDKVRGRTIAVKVKKVLESCKSEFQKIEVYETECFGRMLVIDGIIMLTDFDEFAYHEMIVHVPLSVHPNPRKVLVIGGGDGGAVRELLKHPVEEVHVCEIDKEVISISKKYFPDLASGFDDPRVKVFNEDGAEFVKKKQYDVIIVDSTDPIGPGKALFEAEFYKDLYGSLAEDGIAVTQSESMFYDKELIKKLFDSNKKIFPIVKYYFTNVPTYPSGTIGFSFCSKKYDPIKDRKDKKLEGLKYYNPETHESAFVLPSFIKDIIKG
ncbi:MAG: polyamine aminopropyltransferase [Nanoarchaeota archaeon]|nr:polyamine aminopropyltransferase [Nanoarchaeota archaeon]